ncbi:zinc finger domain-containing protein [Streptomyces sp. BH097]|uniref:zinc finger domain-containing protein n=1 Tax=Streptomyces sp. BH097 TaxID=3410406 RepID=UPI003CF5B305
MTSEQRAALATPCPACQSAAGDLCTSHSGTRPRTNDVHRARLAAHKEATR